ncbi:MAG TPA: nucleotide exchange factor GrpE [Pirellulales bacterium]|nr:nucleotide exchange factor GrpE [Pirellulales bacterium]
MNDTNPTNEPRGADEQAAAADAVLRRAAASEASEDPAAVEDEAEQARRDLDEARDRVLRAQAELDNYRKRARRELDEERRYAALPLLGDLLPVLDNVGRAIQAAEKNSEAGSLVEGVKLVAQQLEGVLGRYHCVRIEALHKPFDPHLHQAIMQQPSAEYPPGTVLQVAQEGYQVYDRVLRPAQVIVSAAADSGAN